MCIRDSRYLGRHFRHQDTRSQRCVLRRAFTPGQRRAYVQSVVGLHRHLRDSESALARCRCRACRRCVDVCGLYPLTDCRNRPLRLHCHGTGSRLPHDCRRLCPQVRDESTRGCQGASGDPFDLALSDACESISDQHGTCCLLYTSRCV